MRWSRAFLPVLKESPADAQIVSHKLMLRAGLVRQTAAGIYAWLPLGFRVLKKIEQIVREEQDRAGALEMLMPTLQSAELWREIRPLRRLRPRDAAHPRPPRPRDALRPDQRGDDHRDLPRRGEELSRSAAHALSYPVEVPRRGPPPLRGHARPRIPDEGRLQLRPRRGRRAAQLLHAMLAYLRTFPRMGLQAVPMQAATGPIGGDLSHEFIVLAADRRERGLLRRRVRGDRLARSRTSTMATSATCTGSSSRSARPMRRRMRSTTTQSVEHGRRGQAPHRPRHRGRPHLLFRRQIYSRDGPEGLGPRRRPVIPMMGSYGIGVRGWWARSSRPAMTRPASSGPKRSRRARRPGQHARRRPGERESGGRALRAAHRRRSRDALRRPRRARRGEVRDDGPDRPALAADRRARGDRQRAWSS